MPRPTPAERAHERLRAAALAYPEAYEETPWGERVVKVAGKIFVFVGATKERGLTLTAKLPRSADMALALPFASPTGYGLGKSGWVTARFGPADDPPLPLLFDWIAESYRAVAPKRLAAGLDAPAKAAATSAEKKAKAPAKKREGGGATVLVVGRDALRLERAERALAERGVAVVTAPPSADALDVAPAGRVRAIAIDLGRTPADGLALAEALAGTDLARVPVVFAGARDAAATREAEAVVPDLRGCFRGAPGDPKVADAIAAIARETRQRRRSRP